MIFDLISTNVIERFDIKLKLSMNTYDGYILIFAVSLEKNYFELKSFPDIESAREWVNNLGPLYSGNSRVT